MIKTTIIYFLLSVSILGCRNEFIELSVENNYFRGLEQAAEINKPIFLHFTCFGCMGYNEFEIDFTESHEVMNLLEEDFVVVELYVDDKESFHEMDTLGISRLVKSTKGTEFLNNSNNKGEVNAIIESELFDSVSQPLYVVVDNKGIPLITPFGYCGKNEKKFLSRLENGLREYQKE